MNNLIEAMNLKERGVTIGDLLIISILVVLTVFVINKLNDSDKDSAKYHNFEVISTRMMT